MAFLLILHAFITSGWLCDTGLGHKQSVLLYNSGGSRLHGWLRELLTVQKAGKTCTSIHTRRFPNFGGFQNQYASNAIQG